MNTRFKNVGFWIGIVGIILTAAGMRSCKYNKLGYTF